MASKRVMFVTTGLNYGGAENQLVNIATCLRYRGWEVAVISMICPVAYVRELTSMGIPVWTLNMRRGVADPRALFRISKMIRDWRPHIIHSHMVHANLLSRMARLACWFPVQISTAHSTIEGGPIRDMAYRLTDGLCDLTTNVSMAGVRRYISIGAVPKRKIIFVPNGVDTSKFTYNPLGREKTREKLNLSSHFVWLAVGRFEPVKDHRTMIHAFSLLCNKYPEMVLLLAGQGPLMNSMRDFASRLGCEDRVRFLGIRRDIPDLMSAADGYLMSSIYEGMPMVLLEAQSAALPAVATDVGGIREVILSGKTGFLVPSQDPKAFSDAMDKMMSLSYCERQLVGRAGREHVEEVFSLNRVADQWEEIYKKLLRNKGIDCSA